MVFAGRSVDPALPNFYRRADVDFGNLRQFVFSKCLPTRKRTKRKSTLLNTQRAAKFLGVGEETLRRYVRGGDLSPRLPKGKISGRGVPMRFSRFELDRFKRRRMDGRLIVSASEAARMIGTDLSWFYKRWVRTGRLAKIEFEDKFGRHFFRRTEVQKLVELKKSTVTGPEAANILKTPRTAVLKMTKRGELIPISGPGIDGFGCHLYLRADIEKYSNRLERESSEGGFHLVA